MEKQFEAEPFNSADATLLDPTPRFPLLHARDHADDAALRRVLPGIPPALQAASAALPLTHAVNLASPLLNGAIPNHILADIAVLLVYALAGFYISLVIFRKRLAQ